ncbi:DUF423 domain-containing protein [Kordiimonas marina]|uniref:DUF423 domain-containing protein n=1 Tax=Kordiimonas marina TaxID=2872312 RepID=UPI001FF5AA1F|nr:DUF423 domain-containing protein [Kordiimonas marina]MCJ9429509.1 DUF423 domain-containing protein [Kordiimonas marina]
MRPGILIALGAGNGLLATILSAVGAHALPSRLGEHAIQLFKQGSEFHLFHALALLLTGVIAMLAQTPASQRWASRAGLAFQAGILCFSGSLYWLAALGPGSLGPLHWLPPLGGTLLMAGWAMLAAAGLKARET